MTFTEKIGIAIVVFAVILLASLLLLATEYGVNPLYAFGVTLVVTISIIFIVPSKHMIHGKVRE